MIMRLAGNPTGCPLQRSGSKGAVGSRRGSYRVASLGLPSSITLPFTYGVLFFSCCDCRKMKEADLTELKARENQQAIAASFSLLGGIFQWLSNTMPFIPSLGIFYSRFFAQKIIQWSNTMPFSANLALFTSLFCSFLYLSEARYYGF